MRAIALATAVSFGLLPLPALSQTVCEGQLTRAEGGGYSIDACLVRGTIARQVLQVCAVDHQCRVSGTLEHCRGVRGRAACGEIVRLDDARVGKALAPCDASAASKTADQSWKIDGVVVLRGTIAERPSKADGEAPRGHTKIVIDLTHCGSGSALPIDQVSDEWIGRHVEVNGSTKKGADGGWYVVARDIRQVPK